MAYADTYNTAATANFQNACYVAAWLVAQDIISDNAASAERKAWANRVMREQLVITPRQLAFQAMRDPTLAAAGVNGTDPQFLNAILSRLNDLVAIG